MPADMTPAGREPAYRQKPQYRLRPAGRTAWANARLAAGLSLDQLAKASGVGKGVLSMLDQGRYTPTPAEAARINAVLGIVPELPSTA